MKITHRSNMTKMITIMMMAMKVTTMMSMMMMVMMMKTLESINEGPSYRGLKFHPT